MPLFLFASDDVEMKKPRIHRRAAGAKNVCLLAIVVPLVAVLAGVSSRPAVAQAVSECSDCKIPSGYTTLKGDSAGSCVNKLVPCKCPGGKNSQYMCLYKVQTGGNLHSDLPANAPSSK